MPAVLGGIEWQTCLRRILFRNKHDSAPTIQSIENGDLTMPTVEVFRGQDAYRFLLETICGLNSPIVGETAVMGQFKEFLLGAKFPKNHWVSFLRHLATNLMIDAKRIRHNHLQGIGSQSYGSIVRQQVKGIPAVAVLGAGKLAREMLPWLIGKTKVRVFYRNGQTGKDLAGQDPEVEFDQSSDTDSTGEEIGAGLVIAAPLQANQVERWMR